jgi:hypothetical protein
MRSLTGIRVASRLITLVVLVAAGAYLLIYLYRWEWNRALMAGIFFLGAEVALIGTAIVSRIRALEHRLGAPAAAPSGDGASERSPFAWLEESMGGFNVFIPILLGAGVILSLVAWAVERVARFVTAPLAGERSGSPLAVIALPQTGLLPAPGSAPHLTDHAEPSSPRASGVHRVVRTAATLAAITVMVAGVAFLHEVAESRPQATTGGTTALDLVVSTRETGATTAQIADALWVSCRLRLPANAELIELEITGAHTASLHFTPALGRTAEQKFVGCLEDAVIDRVSADVTRFETTP